MKAQPCSSSTIFGSPLHSWLSYRVETRHGERSERVSRNGVGISRRVRLPATLFFLFGLLFCCCVGELPKAPTPTLKSLREWSSHLFERHPSLQTALGVLAHQRLSEGSRNTSFDGRLVLIAFTDANSTLVQFHESGCGYFVMLCIYNACSSATRRRWVRPLLLYCVLVVWVCTQYTCLWL